MTVTSETTIRNIASSLGLDPEDAVRHHAETMARNAASIVRADRHGLRVAITNEALIECERQDEKWGADRDHPNGTGPDLTLSLPTDYDGEATASVLAAWAKSRCDDAAEAGETTYEQIATEEFFEALAEVDPAALRVELIQLQAVLVQWVAKIDRDTARHAATVDAHRVVRGMLADDVQEPCS